MTSIRDDIAKALSFEFYEVNGRRFQVSGWVHDEEDPETGQKDLFMDVRYLDTGEHERVSLRQILQNSRNITLQVRSAAARKENDRDVEFALGHNPYD